MERKLYHGSIDIIEKPVYGIGNKHNDYGLGFYCTTIETLAREWAGKAGRNSYVNVYSLRDDNLNILDMCTGNAVIPMILTTKNNTLNPTHGNKVSTSKVSI